MGDSFRSAGPAPALSVRRIAWIPSPRGEERLKLLEESLPLDIVRRGPGGLDFWNAGPRETGRGLFLPSGGELSLLDHRGSCIRDVGPTATDSGRCFPLGCVQVLPF